ncbi:MAG: tetratricopeptide repeat protein [Bacteroidetes bacterium]|nr:tetratricopeptide repeat protein [Bacteroidota bacterium]
MKIKTVYIYLGIFALVIFIIILTTQNSINQSGTKETTEIMPNDDIHKGLNNGESPGKGNVSNNIIHQMEMLQKAVEENPDDTSQVKKYADLLASAHNPEKAVELYKTILNKNPKRIDILLGITIAYYNMRNLEKAEEYTKRILEIDKNNHEANYNLGAIAAGRGNTAKAKEIWENVVLRFPNSSVAQIAEKSLEELGQ